MYFFIAILAFSMILQNPEFIAERLPYLTETERRQLVGGIEDIRKGLWDTSHVGINAFLRNIMKSKEPEE